MSLFSVPSCLRWASAALSLALCACGGGQAPPPAASPEPAAQPAPPPRPATATVSEDGRSIRVVLPVGEMEIQASDVLGGRALRADRVEFLAREDQGDRYDVVLRIQGPSDPKAEQGRCRDGREVVLHDIAMRDNDNRITSTHVYASCLKRLRPLSEQRSPDGRVEYTLEQTDADGDTSKQYLNYNLRHPSEGTTL